MPRATTVAVALLVALAAVLPGASPAIGATSGPAASPAGDGTGATDASGRLDATNRWIVVLRSGSNLTTAETRARGRGVAADRTFRSAVRGYSAKLTPTQLAATRSDPDVAMVVPDAVVTMEAQSTPRGVSRVFATKNPIAAIDGSDQRVDADVAIVDTGIDPNHKDLNVVGGYNCSSSNHDGWQDDNGHGTHVAGIVGAIDNGTGVVGVAPGVRLWAVRILRSDGSGLVSWYVCGLDWIAAQRDPSNPDLPLIEAVNMSVARRGSDDHNCGLTNDDVIHQAICRLVGAGVTVVAAAGNNSFNASRMIPASYNEVITVSALADTDGKPGGRGGNACYSWGTYDKDDTFANFSNYGADVDLIAPGKCILSTLPGNRYGYLSGTSMAAPHVTGAVALYKASRPTATPRDVKLALQALGNLNWKLSSDPDTHHERLLDVSHLVNLGDFMVDGTSPSKVLGPNGGTLSVPITVARAEDVPDEIDLSVSADDPVRATLAADTLVGLDQTTTSMSISVPRATPSGRYRITVTATDGDRSRDVTLTVLVDTDRPTASAATLAAKPGSRFDTTSFTARATWAAATDSVSSIAAYQVEWSVDGRVWSSPITLGSSARSVQRTVRTSHSYAIRVRARDAAGNWSRWAAASPFTAKVVQDTGAGFATSGHWHRSRSTSWSKHTTVYSKQAGATITRAFTGRGISVVAVKGRSRGKAQVWIDGKLIKTINLHRAGATLARRVVFLRRWPVTARHTIRIVVLGTAGHPRVDLDALIVIK
jgi:subtilisin